MNASSSFSVVDVRIEHYRPQYTIGIDECRPRISWKLIRPLPDTGIQTDYEVELYDQSSAALRETANPKGRLLASRKVQSSSSTYNKWPFDQELQSRHRLAVRVKVWVASQASDWSDLAVVEAGLLHQKDWTAKRITSSTFFVDHDGPQPEQLIRKDFVTSTKGDITRARLYVAVQGVYEAKINGHRVGDDFLAPGWSNYNNRIRYQTYDVKGLLDQASEGKHCLAFRLAEGWFCGRLGFFGGKRNYYGARPSVTAQLEMYTTAEPAKLCK